MGWKALAAAVLLASLVIGLGSPSLMQRTVAPAASTAISTTAGPSTVQPLAALGGNWTLLGTQPPGLWNPGWVYDSHVDRFILFGGFLTSTTTTNATWAYDYTSNTWTNITPVVGPQPRGSAAMVYDSNADRVILFGGFEGTYAALNDTWIFDYATDTWTNVTTSDHPSARGVTVMAYDAVADKAILFGGYSNTGLVADTWAYDYGTNTWALRNPTGSPSARSRAALVYNPVARASLLFGGVTISGLSAMPLNDTYTYDYTANVWVHLLPPASPPARFGAGMAYDVVSQRTILFGGANGIPASGFLKDTWAYNATLHTWANLTPPQSPSPRSDAPLAFDPLADRAVLFGGRLATGSASDEVWSYQFGTTLPSAPRALAAVGGTLKVTLTWQTPVSDGGSLITNFTIYRGTTPGGETLLTTVGPVLTYTDSAVTAGTTYFYEVAAINSVGEGPKSNEAHATPTAPDTTPPTIKITAPANNSLLSSLNVTVNGTATDDTAVALVEVSTDGANWIAATGTASWTATLTLKPGPNTIYARATDTAGNKATTQVTVTVQLPSNGPLGLSTDLWIAILVLVVVAVAALVFFLMRRRRKPETSPAVPPHAPPPPPSEPTPPFPPPPPPGNP